MVDPFEVPLFNPLHSGYFFKIPPATISTFSKLYFRNTIRVLNSLYRDWAQRFVGTDLGPNCLQRLAADGTIRRIVK